MNSPRCKRSWTVRGCDWRKKPDRAGTSARSDTAAQTVPQQTDVFMTRLAIHLDGARAWKKIVGFPVQAREIERRGHDRYSLLAKTGDRARKKARFIDQNDFRDTVAPQNFATEDGILVRTARSCFQP